MARKSRRINHDLTPTRIYSLTEDQAQILREASAPEGCYWACVGLVSRVSGPLVEAGILSVQTRRIVTDTPRAPGSDVMCEYDESHLFITPEGLDLLSQHR